jgi:uncharacterized protein with GYD domain
MPTYITLSNFTHQGIASVKDTTKRAEAFKKLAEQLGCTVKEIYWTQANTTPSQSWRRRTRQRQPPLR